MGNRKTRRQKIVADTRHQQIVTHTQSINIPKPQETKEFSYNLVAKPTISYSLTKTVPYEYIKRDLRKITILSTTIFGVELLLYFLLAKTNLSLPFLNLY